jgi:hypothetical protein
MLSTYSWDVSSYDSSEQSWLQRICKPVDSHNLKHASVEKELKGKD